jgi:hypothetical protein
MVPIGLAWLVHPGGQNVYRIIAFIVLVLLALFAALMAAGAGSIAIGVTLALATVVLVAAAGKRAPGWDRRPDRVTAIACIVAPLLLFFVLWVWTRPIEAVARDRAIRRSAPLIADIERYREARGVYPPSLESVWEDYTPGVIGVGRYHYERQGDAYNLHFEAPSFELGARVIVMFNPLDEQVMTSHDMDLLRRDPAELGLRRGFARVCDLPHPHWKCFLFD